MFTKISNLLAKCKLTLLWVFGISILKRFLNSRCFFNPITRLSASLDKVPIIQPRRCLSDFLQVMKASIRNGTIFSVFGLLIGSCMVYFISVRSSLVRCPTSSWLSARAKACSLYNGYFVWLGLRVIKFPTLRDNEVIVRIWLCLFVCVCSLKTLIPRKKI